MGAYHPKCGLHGHSPECSERHPAFAGRKALPMTPYGRGQMPSRIAQGREAQERARAKSRALAETGVNNRLASERTVKARAYESAPKRVIKAGMVLAVRVGHSLMPVAPHPAVSKRSKRISTYIETL